MSRGDHLTVADDAALLDAHIYTGMVQGGFQAHAGVDPAEVVARLEEGDDREVQRVQVEAFYRLMEYFFADGWEPVALIRRVYCVARDRFPDLLQGVSGKDVRAVCDDGMGRLRFAVVYRKLIEGWDRGRMNTWHRKTAIYSDGDGRKSRGETVVRCRIKVVVSEVYAQCDGEDLSGGVSLTDLLQVAGDSGWDGVRVEVFSELMRVFFERGAEPLQVVRRVYAIAKALRPSLIGRMSLEKMAWLCGDGGRATQSDRVNRVYNWLINMFSARGNVRASFQKSASAVEKYRMAQMGNNNRRK